MTEAHKTLSELIARFALRREATTAEYVAGVRLARLGVVNWFTITRTKLHAVVHDVVDEEVELTSRGEAVSGSCSCASGATSVCRHQVAAAHAFWLHNRSKCGE